MRPADAQMLISEVFKRSRVQWAAEDKNSNQSTAIVLTVASFGRAEGYKIAIPAATTRSSPPLRCQSSQCDTAAPSSPQTITVTGSDERGLLFGVGRLLRLLSAEYAQGYHTGAVSSVTVPANVTLTSWPKYGLRGHQLGYRPKTNSYDAWTLADYEQYIVDMALFGTNMIELIPWHSDDVSYSPMFPLSPQATLHGVSAIIDK